MKTLTKNNNSKFIKTGFAFMLLCLIYASTVFGSNGKGKEKTKSNTEEVIEDSLHLAKEIAADFEIEELEELFSLQNEAIFQIFDKNDQIIFSGNEKAWNDKKNLSLITNKRKAEYLFESNGTKIYKVF